MALAMVFMACSDDDNTAPAPGNLDITTQALTFGTDGGTSQFTVKGGQVPERCCHHRSRP